jgi:osmotically-inducible protein OsmY
MKKIYLLAILLFMGLALFYGCASTTGETAGENVTDDEISAKVHAAIIGDPDAHYFKIDANVTKGEVVLTGFVNSRETENRLESQIRQINGVKSVRSLLRIEQKK